MPKHGSKIDSSASVNDYESAGFSVLPRPHGIFVFCLHLVAFCLQTYQWRLAGSTVSNDLRQSESNPSSLAIMMSGLVPNR